MEKSERTIATCRERTNAAQWYQLAEMHLRHHVRQLRRMAALGS